MSRKRTIYAYHLTFLNVLPSISKLGLIAGYGDRWAKVIWFVANEEHYPVLDSCRDFKLRFPFPKDAELKYEIDFIKTGDKLQKEYITHENISSNQIDVKIEGDWLPLSSSLVLEEIKFLIEECGIRGEPDY